MTTKDLVFAMTAMLMFTAWLKFLSGSEFRSGERENPMPELLSRLGSGEIARTASEFLKNFLSAAGGGFVMVFTVIFKTLILHLPSISALSFGLGAAVVGLFTAINYVASFVFMQFAGFQLATKQSSFIGAAIGKAKAEAESLRKWQSRLVRKWRRGELTHQGMNQAWQDGYAAHSSARRRWKSDLGLALATQFLSALGNLAVVCALAILFGWGYAWVRGASFMDAAVARQSLESFDPWRSNTILYATVTGGLLWVSTYWGGLISRRFQEISKFKVGVWSSVCLGVVLSVVPLLGKVFHLGLLDIRHFTLSGGMVALAVASLGFETACHSGLISACFGVISIGLLNFGVSFAIGYSLSRTQRIFLRRVEA